MLNLVKKGFAFLTSFGVITYANVGHVFADGGFTSGYSPYSPYGSHKIVDTSIAGLTDLMIVTGIVLYILGVVVIGYSKKLKGLVQ